MRKGYTTAPLFLAALLAVFPALSGCSSQYGGYDYEGHEVRQAHQVHQAIVVSVETVRINSDTSGRQSLGGLIGAIAGGVAGSTIGHGTGRTLASLGGALLGGAAGAGAGHLSAQQSGLQITIRYQDGAEELIVQGMEPNLQPGQRVRVITGQDGSRRVIPAAY